MQEAIKNIKQSKPGLLITIRDEIRKDVKKAGVFRLLGGTVIHTNKPIDKLKTTVIN